MCVVSVLCVCVCVCVCVYFSHESVHCYLTMKFMKQVTVEAKHTENILRQVYQSQCLLHPIMIINRIRWKAQFKILTGMYILTTIYMLQNSKRKNSTFLRTVLTFLTEFHSFITPKSQNDRKYEIICTHNISTLNAEVCAVLFHHSHPHTYQTFVLLPFTQSCRPQLCKFKFFFFVLMLIIL